jgi:hypothetical protein
MAQSTLDRTGEQEPDVLKGHDTGSLGPSDSSDSGSDIAGNRGLDHDDGLPLVRGTTSDPDEDGGKPTAGPDIGDAHLQGDSDRSGTGERGAAGRDATEPMDAAIEQVAGEVGSDDQPEAEVEAVEKLEVDDDDLPDDAH